MASVMQAQTTQDPVAEVLHKFGERRAALDTIFFKFNIAERGIALFVDVTTRRRQHHRVVEMRASLYTPEGPSAMTTSHPRSALRLDDAGGYLIGSNAWLGAGGSRGSIGNVKWDLVFQPVGPLLDPQVVGSIIHPFDLRLRSVPDMLISGNISIDGHGYSFSHEPGMLGSYYGRRLPDHWYWISANAFDRPGVTLDCMLLDSTIFGLPWVRTRVGYLHLTTPEATMTLMHPLTGQIQISGTREDFTLTARPRHGSPITIHGTAPGVRYQHVGDHIYTTLLGVCSIAGLATTDGLAGIAERESTRQRR